MKLLEDSIWVNFHGLVLGSVSDMWPPKHKPQKRKRDQLDYLEIKTFGTAKSLEESDKTMHKMGKFSSVQLLSHVRLCDPVNHSTPAFPVHHQLPEFTQTHVRWVVMPSSHLILCRLLLLPPPIPPSIRVFSNESALPIRWPKNWSFSFNIKTGETICKSLSD